MVMIPELTATYNVPALPHLWPVAALVVISAAEWHDTRELKFQTALPSTTGHRYSWGYIRRGYMLPSLFPHIHTTFFTPTRTPVV